MFVSVAEYITTQLEASEAIRSEDRDLYRYGIQQGLTILLNVLTTLLIGIVTGMFWESIVFMAAYMSLRRYAGGFHAKTPVRCYIYSAAMTCIVLLAIRFLPQTGLIYVCLSAAGGTVIALFAPVEDKNKPLDETEQHVYCKRTRLVLGAEFLVFVLFVFLNAAMVYAPVAMALISLGVLVTAGTVKNRIRARHQ